MHRWLCFPLYLLLCTGAAAQNADWRAYAADQASTKFSPLSQIHRGNIDSLRVLWRWTSSDFELVAQHDLRSGGNNQSTPLAIDGVLYATTPLNQVFALDAATGRELWSYDPQSWHARSFWPALNRGVAHWRDGADQRLFLGTLDARLIALDAATGTPVPGFGQGGQIDLSQGLRRPFAIEPYAVLSPPLICRDVVVVGSSISDWVRGGDVPPPGDVRAFDARTGKLLWTFHTIPLEGEFGHQTWEGDSAENTGATNAWTPMSADEELGYVYLPVSTPSNDFYGGGRLGDNLFGESLVCLDARTGERVWHFQLVHHGLWDYDPPAAPILVDIRVGGKPVKAVVQLTKQGFAFVFDRVTGEPVWPIEERPVPQSTAPGERSSPTQPFPTRPAPFEPHGLSEDRIIDFTPELRAQTLAFLQRYEYGPLYTPPSEKGTVLIPGTAGGADWAGGAVHPHKGILYVPSHTFPILATLQSPRRGGGGMVGFASYSFTGPQGLPLTRPPYGRITAIDLNTGEHLWMSPTGKGPVDHPLLRHLDLPRLGWDRRTFAMLTPDLLLVAAHGASSIRSDAHEFYAPDDPYLWVYAPESGALLAEIELPDNAQGGMMTYMAAGRQYLAVPIGGRERPAGLVVLGLPQPGEAVDADLALPARYFRDDADHPLYYRAVQALDSGDGQTLGALLETHPELVRARGYLHPAYQEESFRGATLLHHVAGEPIRTRLPDHIAEIGALLLRRGADPDAGTLDSTTALALAVASQQLPWMGLQEQVIEILLQGGASANAGRGRVLWQAIVENKTAIAELLLAHGARLDLRSAAALGRVDHMQGLFKTDGALATAAYPGYRPPLSRRFWGASNRAQSMGGEGSGLSDQDVLDEALSFAAASGQVESAAFLLARGARIDAAPPGLMDERDGGSTALYKAVENERREMILFLLARGADPAIGSGFFQRTPLDLARRLGYAEGERILEDREENAR